MSLSLEATRILGSLWVVWRCEPRSAIRYHPHKRNNKPQHWSIKLSLLVRLSLSLFSLSVFHFRSAAFQEKHCLPGARGPFWNYHQPTNTSPNTGDRKKPGHHKTLACLLFFSPRVGSAQPDPCICHKDVSGCQCTGLPCKAGAVQV